MSSEHDDQWIKNQIDSAVEDQQQIDKKAGRNARSRKRFATFAKFLIVLIAGVGVAEHFYRDEFKDFCKKQNLPVYEICESLGNGSWFDKDKSPLGLGEKAPMGKVKHAKKLLNKRMEITNQVISEDSK